MDELRFYLVNVDDTDLDDVISISDEEFKSLAEEQGLVWGMDGFQQAWNDYDYSDLNVTTQFLRILKV